MDDDIFTATAHELFELAATAITDSRIETYLQAIIDAHYIDDIDFALMHHKLYSKGTDVSCSFDLNISGWKFDNAVMEFLKDKRKTARLSSLIIDALHARISGGYKEISCAILPDEYAIRISIRRTP